MKAYLVLFVLLASILFFPSSLLARELAAGVTAGRTGTPATGGANNSSVPCKSGKGKRYNCSPKRPPKSGSCNKKFDRNCHDDSSP